MEKINKYLPGILFLNILIIQSACTSQKSFFDSKIIIYRSEADSGRALSNTSFIDFYKDTINKINYPFSIYEEEEKIFEKNKRTTSTPKGYLLSNIYETSGVPFIFFRKENSIYISYTLKEKKIEKEYCKLSKVDSVNAFSFDFLCDSNSAESWVTTRFAGDTTIKIPGKKVRCWIFTETYPYLFPNKRNQIIYLDKKSFLPIQINTTSYWPDLENPTVFTTETVRSKIDSVFARPWTSSNKKWNYPRCWKTGFTALPKNQ